MEENIKYKHIHIFGASGSGTTTLAEKLCKKLPHKHLDSDDFFWKTKYTETNPRDVRLNLLKKELYYYDNWILSGAVIDWGNPIIPLFDLVIFISVTNEIRLKRLREREVKRYGDEISPKGHRYKDFLQFMEWADRYETGGMDVRSRYQQKTWLEDLSCSTIELNGDNPVDTNYQIILGMISGVLKET
ncbi:hypothetical protein [Spirochaeta cellobiosiphila]|uniref:hypothetical protein n=1 Tax=Spirochaeta cellobiosiphila TaxID=504483 RepID=UPI00069F7E8F|nr:hypothetical protein [Spirochaeta cellobiosiphila]